MSLPNSAKTSDTVTLAMRSVRPALSAAIVFSFFINLLALSAPLYMLQIYDRVLSSRSIPTLLLLTLLLAFLYAVSASLETIRSKVLVRAGVAFDRDANPDVFRAVQRATIQSPSPKHSQALRDLDSIREFYTGQGLIAFFDFLWVPLFLAAAFLLHPIYGYMAVGAAVFSFFLTVLNERITRPILDKATREAQLANNNALTTFRNAEVLQAMGMVESLRARWSNFHEGMLGWQALASNRAGVVLALSRFNRLLMQSVVLGVGALLVIERQVTPGTMIAASIIVGKALAPVEIALAQWKSFTNMRGARTRIGEMLKALPEKAKRLSLPVPKGDISFEGVIARAPGQGKPILSNISLKINAGTTIGIIGPSAAGKSSILRVLLGVWPILSGNIRIDGSEINHWDPDELGPHIGYLPQDVELFSGTIAENISRFQDDFRMEDVLEAARLAGVHEMIQALPEGYNTIIGDRGQGLSGGQRQRIGLARAMFRMPPIIVLDEPNANLDQAGELALTAALQKMKSSGSTVILVTHKTNILALVDQIAIINSGQIQASGPAEQILAQLANANKVAPISTKTISAA